MGPGQLACAATLLLLSVGPDRWICGGCKTLEFQSHVSQKALTGHVIKSVQVTSDGSCMDECFAENRCASYNLGPFQGGLRICELSDSNDVLHPATCSNNTGICSEQSRIRAMGVRVSMGQLAWQVSPTRAISASAKRALKGTEHCEHDKDECTTQLNDCHEDATCSNTIGSFYCTCKSGFYGDGKNCTVIEYFMADPAESCDSQCDKQGKRCVERGEFPGGNAKEIFAALGFPCARERDYYYTDNPGYDPSSQGCWGNRNIPDAIDCAAGDNPGLRRLCPCE